MPADGLARRAVLCALLAALPATAAAQTSPRAMIRLLDQRRPPPPAKIADMAWIEGHWIGAMPEGPVEHVVLGAAFGHMPGFVRAVSPQGVVFYEISVFVETGDSLAVRVKHFTPALAGWETQQGYIDRPLVARDGDLFYFDGITFQRTGPDGFTVYFLDRPGGVERATLVIPFRRKG
jgi:hypothetical protein